MYCFTGSSDQMEKETASCWEGFAQTGYSQALKKGENSSSPDMKRFLPSDSFLKSSSSESSDVFWCSENISVKTSYAKASCNYESQVTQYKIHVWKFIIILPAFLTKPCIKFSYWSFHRGFFFVFQV